MPAIQTMGRIFRDRKVSFSRVRHRANPLHLF